MTQKQQIAEHLNKYGKITTMQAINLYGITRLSARIWELRHDEGWTITNTRKRGKNRAGKPCHWDEYKKETA